MAVLDVDTYTSQMTDIEKGQRVASLLQQLKEHDVDSFLHSFRVGELAYSFANHLQLSTDEAMKLLNIGLLHDLGKLNIPSSIINKTEPINGQEWIIIKKHVIYGKELLFNLIEFDELDAVVHHHENIDGSGYLGLKGNEISLYSRIIRITDTFDAMTNDRVYQKQSSVNTAINELQKLSSVHYDANLVNEFTRFIL